MFQKEFGNIGIRENMEPGDIVFSQLYKGHFYILLEDTGQGTEQKFKYFSSNDGSINEGHFTPSLLIYLSEGLWEYK